MRMHHLTVEVRVIGRNRFFRFLFFQVGMGSRNFSLGTRDLAQAGYRALTQNDGAFSFASVDALSDRWAAFAAYAKAHGVGRMERIDAELVTQYAQELAERVAAEELSAAYAQNLVSAINSVMHAVSEKWRTVSPTKAGGIPQRTKVRTEAPEGLNRVQVAYAQATLCKAGHERAAAIVGLARELGLRVKEGCLLNARTALKAAEKTGVITIRDGTKGARRRDVPITDERQMAALRTAAAVQGKHHSLVPATQTFAQFRARELRAAYARLKQANLPGFHALRAAYACDRGSTPRQSSDRPPRPRTDCARAGTRPHRCYRRLHRERQMSLYQQIHWLAGAYVRKGGKTNRRLQRQRMLAFARFAQTRGARDLAQIGRRHVIDYYKSRASLSATTRYHDFLAIRILFQLAGKASEPPRPRASSPEDA
jgi:hypothetical protein